MTSLNHLAFAHVFSLSPLFSHFFHLFSNRRPQASAQMILLQEALLDSSSIPALCSLITTLTTLSPEDNSVSLSGLGPS